MPNLNLYCLSLKYYNLIDKLPSYIKPLGLGNEEYPEHWLAEKNGKNIVNLNKYYEMYQNSIFSLTYKKNGWDCLRHYEILANGSIPLFIKLDDCPNNTLTSLPKEKLLKFYNLYNKILNYYNPLKIYKKRFRDISKFYCYGKNFFKKLPSADSFIKKNQEINQIRNYLLEYTKNNLTSEKLAEYVINTSNTFFK